MLSSSIEYLQALRNGNYLRFLEWPQFIAQHYADPKYTIGADETLPLIIFEWLNNGFCEEDIKHMAVLTVVHDLDSSPIRAGLSYAFISLSLALISCMVYQSTHTQSNFLKKGTLTGKEVCQLMQKQSALMDKTQFAEQQQIEISKLTHYQEIIDRKVVAQAFEQINSVTQYRYLTEDYISVLENTPIAEDQLRVSRISMLKSLAHYLNERMEYTEEVKEGIGVYVTQLWAMNPADFEEEYLNKLSSYSFVANIWKMAVTYGLKFFSILQPSTTLAITDDTSNTPKMN
ncbi:helical bundle domain-containing protein [Legionella quateirensis]|uniref:Uncharacterized protein n=1 Tax=Legionella quateirensis TaxID=45072 RepID=A0A378KPR1_9GAMM|nr:helical bundle domain-containing protein [Legionella quateirensis]KTD55371.1 hypothetical protein Lqua_0088 [Legionella quateirensis]STY16545.1 Uncharacterised protein [Legionella quateirensis]